MCSIEPEDLIYLEDFRLPNFTCTGFTYDSVNDTYWIGDHGITEEDPVQLYQINSDMNELVSCVQIEEFYNDGERNLQGVAYDYIDDMLWCAIGKSIIEVTKDGEIKKSISNEFFEEYKANGINVDPVDATLWVLCASEKLLHIDRTGNVIEEIAVNYYAQDMIYVDNEKIYITIGADYTGNDNYLAVYDKESQQLTFEYRLINSYAIEGVYINNNRLYIVNDGLYHNCMIPKSYISVYDLSQA